MSTNATILIVEDELITAESIAELLTQEDYEIAGISPTAAGALDLCEEKRPHVVICDINIRGGINGLELAKQLKRLYHCEVIFLTAYTDAATIQAAAAAEPVMYVVKPFSDAQLLVAVQMAFHKYYFKAEAPASGKVQLSDREMEVVQLVAQGLSSKQIARKLFISEETVKTHRRRMLHRNNISNFPQLIYQLGLK
jgi:DNA-binding NarL/FixJ family response regulator